MRLGATIWILGLAMAAGAAHAESADQLRASWPENDLERLLVASATDKSRSSDFIRTLLNSEICALAQGPLPSDAANPDEKIRLLGVTAPDGQPVGPVFTSRHRATDIFGSKHAVVCGKADALLNALRGGRVVIDPGQPFGVLYTAEELDHILGEDLGERSLPQFQMPGDAPPAMIQKLKDVLVPESRIMLAWLSLAYWPEKKEWSWYLDLETTIDTDKVHATLRDAASQIDMLGRPLDIVINGPIEHPELGIILLKR